jgi:2-hydroxycyclohexanecarboxyl-CoA dehydrogenase
MTRSLGGRVAVITGAGSGMGRAMALRLAEDHAKIAIWDINRQGAEETANMVRDAGGTAIAIEADCSSTMPASPRSRHFSTSTKRCSNASYAST